MPDRPAPSASRSLMARAEARTPLPAPRPIDEVLIPPNRWTPPLHETGFLGQFATSTGAGQGQPVQPLRGLFGMPIEDTAPLAPPADRNNPLWGRDVNLSAPPRKGPTR